MATERRAKIIISAHELAALMGQATTTALNQLERAVLQAVAVQYPEAAAALQRQFQIATCIKRENTGVGFFTTLAIDRHKAPPVALRSPIGDVYSDVHGLTHPVGFLVFLRDGYATLLEGYTVAGDSTVDMAFDQIAFSLQPAPSLKDRLQKP
ncbi:MAG TPA: hypothetical protein VHY35_15740 [Stellaceae bacterium]|nr:hypothetical protein [Stellaceae bacterium]